MSWIRKGRETWTSKNEAQQSTMVVKGSFKHLQPINEDYPNISINEVATTTYKKEIHEK